MMSPDELRALADALEPMAAAPRFDGMPVVEFCAWLRQCAEEKPVAWRVEVRWTDTSRDNGRWRKYADYGTEKAAVSSQQRFAHPGDIESRIVPLYPHPAPAAPQAKPPRQAGQEISLGALMREQRQSRIVAGAFPDGNPAAKAMIAQTPQAEPCIGNDPACPCQDGDPCHYRDTATTKAWPIPQAEPKREPLSDDEISKLAWKRNVWIDGMIEFSILAFAREIENAHGIGGSDAE